MISADQAVINVHGFLRKGINPHKNPFNSFVNDYLSPRIEMISDSGERRATFDVRFYDAHIRGFYESLREQLMKSGFGFDFTNYPEDVVITW